MREIKFRGKMATGQWVYGLLSEDRPNSTAYYNKCKYRISWFGKDGAEYNAPVLTETVGQFTGLLDKNGKEIYEGDRLSMKDEVGNKGVVTVGFEDGGFIVFKGLAWRHIGDYDVEKNQLEIIGNVHDKGEEK